MIIDKFVGFIGNVTNIDGEGPNFGKVQVRIVGDQGQAVIQDDDLLWASLMMPITSAAERGVGTTPNWLVVGTTVVGYFLDGQYRNMPLIVGTLNQDKKTGHGISPLASGENIPRVLSAFEKDLGVQDARKPNYNNNKVISTASKEEPGVINHIIEIDDTPQSERILIKHKSGSYVEFLPNGTVVLKGIGNIGATADNIKVRAKTITLVADDTISIDADEITLEAKTINMNGNTAISGDVTIDGDSVAVNASTVTVIGAMTLNGRPVATT